MRILKDDIDGCFYAVLNNRLLQCPLNKDGSVHLEEFTYCYATEGGMTDAFDATGIAHQIERVMREGKDIGT